MNIPTLIQAAVLSFLPIFEVRGGLPLAYYTGNSIILSFIICAIFNILAIPFCYFFLERLNSSLLPIDFYRKYFYSNLKKARTKVGLNFNKYGYLGLMIFVAIPLPLTGAYTGTLGAWALGLDRKKAFFSIAAGVIIAALIVSLVLISGTAIFNIFIKY